MSSSWGLEPDEVPIQKLPAPQWKYVTLKDTVSLAFIVVVSGKAEWLSPWDELTTPPSCPLLSSLEDPIDDVMNGGPMPMALKVTLVVSSKLAAGRVTTLTVTLRGRSKQFENNGRTAACSSSHSRWDRSKYARSTHTSGRISRDIFRFDALPVLYP